MKKYLLGLFAVVLAIGFSSYTHIARFNTTYFYQAPGGSYADADVVTLSNWTTSSITCSSLHPDVACSISVPAGNILQDGTLDGTKVTIVDQQFATNQFKVIAGTGYSSPANKQAP